MHNTRIALLVALFSTFSLDTWAEGIDTANGTSDLPFSIQSHGIMDMNLRGLAILTIAQANTACGVLPGTSTAVPIGTLAQDGTGVYLSCQAASGQPPGMWQPAFGGGNATGIMSGWGGQSWPDAIKCTDASTPIFGNPAPAVYVFLISYSLNKTDIQYLHANWSQNAYTFNADGSPHDGVMFSSDSFTVPTDCDHKSIQQIIAEGHGYFMFTSSTPSPQRNSGLIN